ncbi:hypothetical protein SEA_PHELPSODU_54 [Mycobacterium phage PhelpsODU]|uniref:Uncharacterized protein n=1 Tax=Mycobacterium phage Unicorn TaxID=2015825 RepID=A0A222ZKZ8_9CAUD|nr:hypothetical protein I5G78_gp052 [Mycobacterium phage Unicorn]ASR85065.1 hypothetical protein SEA_UNICORN_54 [Mycobacterium phage Unicorn]ASR85164.1 hypothetical protein SEA_PHELPSODU_54 [Mycobacterium phage PhelpsODU]
MSADRPPLCEVCGLYEARVFDPCGAMWCRVCDLMGLGDVAVRERVAEIAAPSATVVEASDGTYTMTLHNIPKGPPTFDVDSLTGAVDYAAINRTWREQMGEPNDADSLAEADKAYVWEDAAGAHWGWLNGNGWVAWGTSKVPVWGRPAVAPFKVAYMRDLAELALMVGDGKPAGEPVTSTNADASNGCGPDDVCTQALGEHVHLGYYDEGTELDESNVNEAAAATREAFDRGEPLADWELALIGEEQADDSGDMVNHPSHYTQGPPCKGCGRPIECLDITEGMGFCLGNTVKYVWRCDLKHDAIEDLRKARVYLDREIARREAQLVANFKNRNTTKG